jgi:hypothetical protein
MLNKRHSAGGRQTQLIPQNPKHLRKTDASSVQLGRLALTNPFQNATNCLEFRCVCADDNSFADPCSVRIVDPPMLMGSPQKVKIIDAMREIKYLAYRKMFVDEQHANNCYMLQYDPTDLCLEFGTFKVNLGYQPQRRLSICHCERAYQQPAFNCYMLQCDPTDPPNK